MRVLFCHDGPLSKDGEGNYYGIAHNNEMFSRYYNIAEEIAVVIRVKSINNNEKKQRLSQITVSPFEVIECPNISSIKGMALKRKEVRKMLEEEIRKSDYIVSRLPSMIGTIAVDIAKRLNKPYLVEMVACPWDGYWNHSLKGKIISPIMYNATRKRVKESKYVVYVTNEFLQKRYPTKGKQINCSNVSLTEFDESILLKRINKIEAMNLHNKIVLGTTAAVDVKFKGQQYVIQALGELKEQGITNFEYQLVGDGNQEYLRFIANKCGVEEQVKFLGAMPHNKVFEWLENIDLYIQPSKQEGLPRALIEAMSRGVPALGARTAGIPELISNEAIFTNKSNMVSEITAMLKGINKEFLFKNSKQNYNESKKYAKNVIENRRKEFFKKYKNFL